MISGSEGTPAEGVRGSGGGTQLILTYHVEGEWETPSREVYAEIERQVALADEAGYHAVWYAEHHFHVHRGHMPNPLLLALHTTARTRQIHAGSAVICVGLHDPLRLAEDLITADVLSNGRLSIGLGSGSTAEEYAAFGVPPEEQAPGPRHARFAAFLDVLEQAWSGGPVSVHAGGVDVEAPAVLPRPIRPLSEAVWMAANSAAQAEVAGRRGYGLMLSRERSMQEMESLHAAFGRGRAGAGRPEDGGRIAASRALLLAPAVEEAHRAAQEAIDILVERQRQTRAQYASLPAPASFEEACRRVQFLVGTAEEVADELTEMRRHIPFTAVHIQPRWQGLAAEDVERTIRLFAAEVGPRL